MPDSDSDVSRIGAWRWIRLEFLVPLTDVFFSWLDENLGKSEEAARGNKEDATQKFFVDDTVTDEW